MCYKCQVCGEVVPQGRQRLTHRIMRDRHSKVVVAGTVEGRSRSEIARELAVCVECHFMLDRGVPLEIVKARRTRDARPSAPVILPIVQPAAPDAAVKPKRPADAQKIIDKWKTRGGGSSKP